MQARIRKLQLKEDEFNRNAALVPESDPNVALINDKIAELKQRVESASEERTRSQVDYKKVFDQRRDRFLEFFDHVARNVEVIYAQLTMKEGQTGRAQLYLEDKLAPFERQIHFTP